jgi:hypothetical protein
MTRSHLKNGSLGFVQRRSRRTNPKAPLVRMFYPLYQLPQVAIGAQRFRIPWYGTHDPSAYLAVPAAIQFQAEHDWPAIRQRCHALVRQAMGHVYNLTGLLPLYPERGGIYHQMARACRSRRGLTRPPSRSGSSRNTTSRSRASCGKGVCSCATRSRGPTPRPTSMPCWMSSVPCCRKASLPMKKLLISMLGRMPKAANF